MRHTARCRGEELSMDIALLLAMNLNQKMYTNLPFCLPCSFTFSVQTEWFHFSGLRKV